jgi:mono/diheme cytochrome c family protein
MPLKTILLALASVTSVALYSAAQAETPLERGTYLMEAVVACGNCHTPKGPTGDIPGMELAGMAPMEKTPGFDANAPNITPDPETGIGNWTDDEIIASIREGKRPDGTIIGPPMPIGLYRDMSDEDVRAIVAYLRQVKPIRNEIPPSVYRMPLPPAYGPPVVSVTPPSRDDQIAYGTYLAGPLAHCTECHSLTEKGPDFENNLGGGGYEFHGPWGVSVASNITPTGLAARTDDEIRKMITTGTRPDGAKMLPPMAYPYYAKMKPDDLDAIIAYLRTLEPL